VNDATLVRSLATDESGEALRSLYRAYSGELYGFAVSALGDRGLAEELVQEVFTRVWRHGERFDPSRSSFRTWMYGIARHAIIDMRRRAAVRPRLADGEPTEAEQASDEAVDEPIERAMLRWQVAAALDRLTPDHRQVVRLAYFQGLTLREIADATGLPIGTVKSRTSYALRNLRLTLEEMGAIP
jgi:RNA polymerase sigma-70 factor (ECF subfamily)